MRLIFLGDIHGNYQFIHYYIDKFDIHDAHIIQLGDFGLGFKSFDKDKRELEMYHEKLVNHNVFLWAIRGNHDYKPYFDNDPFGFTNIKLVADYTVLNLEDKNILCLGGAVSIDRMYRMTLKQIQGEFNKYPGQNWYPDENFFLDENKLKDFRNIDIVVSHTAPDYCPIDNSMGVGPFIQAIIDQTNDLCLVEDLKVERKQMANAFHTLRMNNDIKYHYYGHFHRSDTITMYGIKHRLLNTGEFWEENNYE